MAFAEREKNPNIRARFSDQKSEKKREYLWF